ncbi:MAG: 4Fe-4S dicluster domain-containing protein [Planctomycetaceae bacterium]|nr:4Fe-4S dicluster domain-containing protein [Planctomycetaceae bacterium]
MSEAYLLSRKRLPDWIKSLAEIYTVLGPVPLRRGQTVFEPIASADLLNPNYCSTMLSPRLFIYPGCQKLFTVNRSTGQYVTADPRTQRPQLIFAIHPCDMHAISVLDRTFLAKYEDYYYRKRRDDTVTIVLNCNKACDSGFCDSMGTGPFLRLKQGFDVALTAREKDFIAEPASENGERLIGGRDFFERATAADLGEKEEIEQRAKRSFTKHLDTDGLPQLLMRHLDHTVYRRTADSRCLGCTNCTMVCPTCYCYNVQDRTGYDLMTTTRQRYWDSCQELHFAQVHGGNFRSSREARMRQFVTHKLATWVEQYGCFGCIGCGRCMTWCPTGIDLTEMAKEIQRDAAEK